MANHLKIPHKSAEPLERNCLGYRWQTHPAPEARWKLAGGGAKRNHRSRPKMISRPGRDAGPRFAFEPIQSGAIPGREGYRRRASGGSTTS